MPTTAAECADATARVRKLADWVNDLPGTLSTIRRALRPNGLFLGAMLGGDTLAEMRSAFVLADLERRGGVAPHMSPLCSVADAGALLQAAGFALPAVDTEVITIRYPDAWTLWHHLRAMGESHSTLQRGTSERSTLLAAAAAYAEVYGDPADGSIPASFQIIYLTGWSPHDSQARPLPRGSANISLKDLNLPVRCARPAWPMSRSARSARSAWIARPAGVAWLLAHACSLALTEGLRGVCAGFWSRQRLMRE